MSERIDTKEELFLVRRARSFVHAGRGIIVLFNTTPHAWIQLSALAVVIILATYFQVTLVEWLLLILAAGIVLVAEAFNTAIEIDINLTSPEFHPYARDTKDVAAGAVLIASLIAAIIGVSIFAPRIVELVLK